MVSHFTMRKCDEKTDHFKKKKIGFDCTFDVTKCLQQIEIPVLINMCA